MIDPSPESVPAWSSTARTARAIADAQGVSLWMQTVPIALSVKNRRTWSAAITAAAARWSSATGPLATWSNSFAALDSDFAWRDIEYALSQKPFKRRLIPVLVGDSEDFPRDRIPWIFDHLQTIQLGENGEDEEQLKQIARVLKEAA